MAALTVQDITITGADGTLTAAAGGGDTFINNGKTFFRMANGDAGAHTFIPNGGSCSFGYDHDTDFTVSVPASQDWYIGPFPVSIFGTTVSVTYDGVTSVTVAAVRFP